MMQEGSVNLVIIDFCGKIPRTLVSNKLKMYIANIPEDWKEEIAGEILKEIRQQKFDILESIVNGTQSYEMEYSLSHLQNIIRFNINADISHEINSIEKCVQYLVDNMICLYFDYEDEDMPFLIGRQIVLKQDVVKKTMLKKLLTLLILFIEIYQMKFM